MKNATTTTISPTICAELNAFICILSDRLKRYVSVDEALTEPLPLTYRNKLGDFAGAWAMRGKVEEESAKSLKELWGTWKMD